MIIPATSNDQTYFVHSEIPVHDTFFSEEKNTKVIWNVRFWIVAILAVLGGIFPLPKPFIRWQMRTCSYVRSSAIPLWVEGCVHPRGIASAPPSSDLELVCLSNRRGFILLKKSPTWQICSTWKFQSNTRLCTSNTHLSPSLAYSYKAYEPVGGHVAGYVREWVQELQATEC